MQYLLLFNGNNGSALAPQCNVAGTSAVVTAASDLSKADLRRARLLRLNSACSCFVLRTLATASGTLTATEFCLFLLRFTQFGYCTFRVDFLKPKTARYPSFPLQSVAGCGFDFTKLDTVNSLPPSSANLHFFICEGVLTL